jgi:RNA polymerase sigma factor (sigma-70 family)
MTESQQLLAAYATHGSEEAFRELVGRYVHLVFSTALRLLEGDAHLAEDVTQEVFVRLSRRARALARESLLGGWLHRDTCFVASKAMRRERRRRAREHQAVLMNALPDPSEAELELVAPVLDEAINRLGREDRAAILLRFFEQLDYRGVGAALGSNEDAARMRVTRALEKLRVMLGRRGVTLSAGALGALLASQAVNAAPMGLAASVAGAVLAGSSAGAGLAATLLKSVFMTKVKFSLISAAILASATTSLVIEQQARARLRETDESLRQQSAQLARVQADNQRVSNLAAKAAGVNDREELLRLRADAAALRNQAASLAAAREENRQLQAALTAARQRQYKLDVHQVELPEERKGKQGYAKQLILGARIFANENGHFPTNLSQVAASLANRETNYTADQFELVFQGSLASLDQYAHPGGMLMLREKEAWKTPAGDWAKIYAMADGGSIVFGGTQEQLAAWEKQHILPPAPQKP